MGVSHLRIEIGASLRMLVAIIDIGLKITDQGLSEDEQVKLFTPFTRLHQSKADGHGLGLSIVQRIVEKLGGKVGVESQSGNGATFYFTLPAAESLM